MSEPPAQRQLDDLWRQRRGQNLPRPVAALEPDEFTFALVTWTLLRHMPGSA